MIDDLRLSHNLDRLWMDIDRFGEELAILEQEVTSLLGAWATTAQPDADPLRSSETLGSGDRATA